ncbi:hypothetical protein DID88_002612 [Monilinia fructigena]|uniref:Raptor N-terminal CASPase-like domain-containing protein n=1 Tax=Monilinia fructigena TaxID=38457 RepID=A0A395IPV3_9HELO|nr:hypothetical protein DID88_002612 [Monilinia fructigena]
MRKIYSRKGIMLVDWAQIKLKGKLTPPPLQPPPYTEHDAQRSTEVQVPRSPPIADVDANRDIVPATPSLLPVCHGIFSPDGKEPSDVAEDLDLNDICKDLGHVEPYLEMDSDEEYLAASEALRSEFKEWLKAAMSINENVYEHSGLSKKLFALGDSVHMSNVGMFDAIRPWCSALFLCDPTGSSRPTDEWFVSDMAGLIKWVNKFCRGAEMTMLMDDFLKLGSAARYIHLDHLGPIGFDFSSSWHIDYLRALSPTYLSQSLTDTVNNLNHKAIPPTLRRPQNNYKFISSNKWYEWHISDDEFKTYSQNGSMPASTRPPTSTGVAAESSQDDSEPDKIRRRPAPLIQRSKSDFGPRGEDIDTNMEDDVQDWENDMDLELIMHLKNMFRNLQITGICTLQIKDTRRRATLNYTWRKIRGLAGSHTPSSAEGSGKRLGKSLQAQYETLAIRTRYKQYLDPSVEETKKFCISLRRNAKEERVLFHYNGHAFRNLLPLEELENLNKDPNYIVTNYKPYIHLAACGIKENLPTNPLLPADVFTACLLLLLSRWHYGSLSSRNPLPSQVSPDEPSQKLPGRLQERRTPLGELNWIFTAITDTIAWTTLPRPLFRKFFRQDLMVAALFRNFLLSQRIMSAYGCHPRSYPELPDTHQHPLWESWDLAVEMALAQLPSLEKKEAGQLPDYDSRIQVSSQNSSQHLRFTLSQGANADNPLLRQWACLCISQLWNDLPEAKWRGIRENAPAKLSGLVRDVCCEVRAAMLYAMTTFLGIPDLTDEVARNEESISWTVIELANDGNAMVRKELWSTFRSLSIDMKTKFWVVAFEQLQEEREYRQSPPVDDGNDHKMGLHYAPQCNHYRGLSSCITPSFACWAAARSLFDDISQLSAKPKASKQQNSEQRPSTPTRQDAFSSIQSSQQGLLKRTASYLFTLPSLPFGGSTGEATPPDSTGRSGLKVTRSSAKFSTGAITSSA